MSPFAMALLVYEQSRQQREGMNSRPLDPAPVDEPRNY
jgi:hypothetical protein